MESFFHTLKGEKIRGKIFRHTADLRKAISNYINKYYNSIRLHTGINDMSPIEYEKRAA
jgi:transposase InsO family protein